MPVTIERLAPLTGLKVPNPATEYIFDIEDVMRLCAGVPISDGFFALPGARNIKAYKLLSATYDPILPPHPGLHGAHISGYGNGKDVSETLTFYGLVSYVT